MNSTAAESTSPTPPPPQVFRASRFSPITTIHWSRIKTLQTDIGTLVTVVIHMTPDRGSTTFSLLIPRVNLPPADVANITAEGITTLQKFSLPLPVGQTQFYTVHTLHGTARFVVG
jgi:hypothetical protein